ncbi:MAG TPA: hypothetical protein VGC80_01705 [Acetobacteraceae bacterium]|jgi:hypothetical protein
MAKRRRTLAEIAGETMRVRAKAEPRPGLGRFWPVLAVLGALGAVLVAVWMGRV